MIIPRCEVANFAVGRSKVVFWGNRLRTMTADTALNRPLQLMVRFKVKFPSWRRLWLCGLCGVKGVATRRFE
jgi:hypothetical protein